MHRIDTPTAQKDKFGARKNGFTRGNPQTGTPATDLDDDYFDMLQEELAGVVEASGVNLEKSKHNQLLTALKALLLSRAHPFADIKADGAAAIAEALSNLGLENVLRADHASFAGFESNDPAIPYMRHVTTDAVIRLATTTALQNGLNDKQDKDATLTTLSGKDANGILQYLGYESGSGWVKLPGGLIIQRGRIGHQVGITSVLVTLPRAFTSLEYSVAQSWSDVQNIATGDTQNPASNGTQFSSRTLTTFQSWQAGPGGFNTDYIAIGY
ncbi:gp53-like domain-containing protein [Citrobacter portucalensis]|uniref:gp53-like domain-containing protein n=1 Tax=Citrobacter freundii complex sp. 2024EL-00216 TaxID=3374258 RepID=UPI0037515B80